LVRARRLSGVGGVVVVWGPVSVLVRVSGRAGGVLR
jgi:hypothetical protein